MLKLVNFLMFAALIFDASMVRSEAIVEDNREFIWKEVIGTEGYSEPGNPNSERLPWYVNIKNLSKEGNLIFFEAVSPEAEYVRYRGNCQSDRILIQFTGYFETKNKIVYFYTPKQANTWFAADSTQQKMLDFVCNYDRS